MRHVTDGAVVGGESVHEVDFVADEFVNESRDIVKVMCDEEALEFENSSGA